MRVFIATALTLALTPSIAFAQDWKDWAQQNPTYPTQAQPTPRGITAPKVEPETPAISNTPAAPNTPAKPPLQPNLPVAFQGFSSTQSPAFEAKFMETCAAGNGPSMNRLCACTLQGVQNNYTFPEFMTIAAEIQATNEIPNSMKYIIVSCLSKLSLK